MPQSRHEPLGEPWDEVRPRRAVPPGSATALILAAVLARAADAASAARAVGRRAGRRRGRAPSTRWCVMRLSRHDWMHGDVAVVVRQLVGAVLAGLVVALAAGYLDRLDVVAVLLFAAVHLSVPVRTPGPAPCWPAPSLVDGALSAVWLVWQGADVPTLLFALALLSALQLVVLAQAKAAGATAASDKLRSSAHAATAERVGTAIDVLGVTRAVLDTSRESYPMATHAAVLLYDVGADRLRPLPLYLGPDGVGSMDNDNLDFTLAPGEGLAGRIFSASRPTGLADRVRRPHGPGQPRRAGARAGRGAAPRRDPVRHRGAADHRRRGDRRLRAHLAPPGAGLERGGHPRRLGAGRRGRARHRARPPLRARARPGPPRQHHRASPTTAS